MKTFKHINAKTIDEAVSALGQGKAMVIAGGTDLLGTLKDEVLPEYPETIINLKSIAGLSYIKEEGGVLKIGALTLLDEIANSDVVKTKYAALAQAAGRVASPHIREMGTIGGNICQLVRCWYFRVANNRFNCIRKGGSMCYAMAGDNRYHSIFGGVNACFAVNPSDTAAALVALDAKIVTSKKTINAEDFWDAKVPGSTVLEAGEIVKEIQVPAPAAGAKSAFLKFAIRKSIDFPIVNCAVLVSGGNARICLNAVYNKPWRATKAEEAISGKTINETNAATAAAAAVNGNLPLAESKYKLEIAKTLVKRALLECK